MVIVTGAELYADLRSSRLLPTGCTSIDSELLQGGMREGHLIELCGEPASGKTQLCLSAAAQTLLRGEPVLWIDTGASFSATRLVGLLCTLRPALGDPTANAGELDEILGLLSVAPAEDAHALLDLLGSIAATPRRWGLVVCDTVTAVATPLLGPARHAHGRALVAGVGSALKACAAAQRCPVLATNAWVGKGNAGRPALGEAWRAVPHVRVRLERVCHDSASPDDAGDPWTAPAVGYAARLLASTCVAPQAKRIVFGLGAAGVTPA